MENSNFLLVLTFTILVLPFPIFSTEINDNPLIGQHFTILPFDAPPSLFLERNSTGHITGMKGTAVPILDWLSRSLQFTYSILQTESIVSNVEDTPRQRGLISYFLTKQIDFTPAVVTLTNSRFQFVDFPYPWASNQLAAMIPIPKANIDLASEWLPFQMPVWICLLIFIMVTMGSLYLLSKHSESVPNNNKNKPHPYSMRHFLLASDYVVSVLLLQGGYCWHRRLYFRILAGAWCLTCFVLTTAYSSVLISFVTMPNYQPLIRYVYELQTKSKVGVTVEKGFGPDLIFMGADGGICKLIGDKLRHDHHSMRCNTTDECVTRVKRSSTSIFIQSYPRIVDIIGRATMANDIKCDFTVAPDKFMQIKAGMLTAKNSILTEQFSRELMRMEAAGMIDQWRKNKQTVAAKHCLDLINDDNRSSSNQRVRLTLANLSGPFFLFISGSFLSIIVLIKEISI